MRGGEGGGEESLIRLGSVSSAILMKVRSIRFDGKSKSKYFSIFLAGGTVRNERN